MVCLSNESRSSISQQSTILLVDDTLDNLELLDNLLSDQGYEVRRAINGPMALRAAASDPPDLILLDIMMPEMDGYEVCAKLMSSPNTWAIPIIFISALNDVFDKVKGLEIGAVDYLSKPFKPEEVLARVRTHIDNSALKKEVYQQQEHLVQQSADFKEQINSLSEQKELERLRAEQYLNRIHLLEKQLQQLGVDPEQL